METLSPNPSRPTNQRELQSIPQPDRCSDCPPVGYPTDVTRCVPCPLRGSTGVTSQGNTGLVPDECRFNSGLPANSSKLTPEPATRLCNWEFVEGTVQKRCARILGHAGKCSPYMDVPNPSLSKENDNG
jgi:hypothetical protein